jgi:hypothetical protein
MSLTEPRSPIIIGGVEFPHWRQFSDASIVVHVPEPEVHAMVSELGNHVVGQHEDGANVLWLISTINIVPEGAEVIVFPEVPLPEVTTRIMAALPMAAGHLATDENATPLEGQWLTILLAGQHILTRIVEAAPTPDGTRVDLVLDAQFPGLVLQVPEAE